MIHDVAVDEREWAAAPPLQQGAIRRHVLRLKSDPAGLGERIQTERVPKKFHHYGNLYRLALPEGWRALYTIRVRKDVPPGVRIVFIGDHKRYDRLFGYRS
ncbi:MAG: hypothetical protein WDA16_00660 [Candidatus Thermoplasmatota archaeon]